MGQARAGGGNRPRGLEVTAFTGRREDPRLLKGEGRYTADWNFPNQLYAAAAQDAVERIEIDYEDLPVLLDGMASLAPGAPLLHDSVPGNLAIDYIYGDEAATADALARAHHVTKLTLESTRVIGNPMEP